MVDLHEQDVLGRLRPGCPAAQPPDNGIHTVFLVEADWSRAEATVIQDESQATIDLSGDGDLGAGAEQARRFLSLDRAVADLPAAPAS